MIKCYSSANILRNLCLRVLVKRHPSWKCFLRIQLRLDAKSNASRHSCIGHFQRI